ncbi:MAG TPA: DUF2911 domain-containing protein [Vicinamibacteria bacterium]|nr:DUF2911 domain-containing protein [Vicinamibacteria bacterium]
MLMRHVLLAAAALAAAAPGFAHAAPRGLAKALVAGKSVSIEYGRPSLAGRDMLGRATPGEAWRMGADAATKLTTEADLSFGSAAVPKGTYVLKATPDGKGAWTLNVLKEDETKVADVPFVVGKAKETVETFTIELRGQKDKGEIELLWGETSLKAAFTGK